MPAQLLQPGGGGGSSSSILGGDPAVNNIFQLAVNHYDIGDGSTNSTHLLWYKARPYGFKFTNAEGASSTIYLPILPSNLNIRTNFATNITTTLYGVVEQHSENRYYDISIQGTTGFGPQFLQHDDFSVQKGRDTFGNNADAPFSLGGFLPEITNSINQLTNSMADIVGEGESNPTGLNADTNGYVAFHNFYRFLLEYKRQISQESEGGTSSSSTQAGFSSNTTSQIPGASGERSKSAPLQFLNYKDGNQYDVVIQNFTLNRSADKPFLYNYSITMKAYNLTTVASDSGVESLNDIKERLGVNGLSSFSKTTRVVSNVSSLVSGIL
jgi:hypothetical protein